MPADLLLLVARPTPSGVDERSLARLAAAVAARTDRPVRTAHLDQADPSVHAALDEATTDGVREVLIVALALPDDRYLTGWIARAVAHWRNSRDSTLDVRVSASLTDHDGLADLIAGIESGHPVTAGPRGFASPAWSELETYHRHLLVCRGPRCTVYAAGPTHRALADATRDDPGVLVTPVGCLGPCNLGPLVVDHPTGQWHTGVDPAGAARIAATGAEPTP